MKDVGCVFLCTYCALVSPPPARTIICRAWEILESNLGRANPDVGAACISLGNLAIICHRPTEATDWFRRALRTFEVEKYTRKYRHPFVWQS